MNRSTNDLAGTVLNGRYALVRLERSEELGGIWLGEDQQAGRRVAVKVLHPDLSQDDAAFKRFGREITNTMMVSQRNTVEVFDWGEDDGLHYLVTEHVRGPTLTELLADGPLAPERAARITGQIARALGAAHQEGIVHRALTPDTILLVDHAIDGDYVKVRDFGLSKLESAGDEETALTAQDMRVGNAAYMAPEYIRTGTYPTKGDLYALGALLHHMLTGAPPFSGTDIELLEAHVERQPTPPSATNPEVPEWLDALVASLLDKAPEQRPGAYRVVQQIESGLGGPLRLPELYPLDANGDPIVPKGPPKVAVFLGVALLGGLVLVLILLGVLVVLVALLAIGAASVT